VGRGKRKRKKDLGLFYIFMIYLNIIENAPRNDVSMTSRCHSMTMMSFRNSEVLAKDIVSVQTVFIGHLLCEALHIRVSITLIPY